MSGNRALAPNMIGRRDQLRELESYLEQVRAGAGQIVFLAGDAGVGKTRLVREFAAQQRSGDQALILEGRCYDEDPATPYGPFLDALRTAIREFGPGLAACDPWADDLARLLPEIESAAPTLRSSDEPQIQKRRLFEAIYAIMRPQDAQTCRIVVLEDFHWSDQTSQELIRYLARVIARDRLLLLITYRSNELHRRHPLAHLIAQLNRDRLYQEIRLAPLSREEQTRLIETTLDRALPVTLLETLYDRTGGNPFFAEELLKSLLAHDQLDALIQATQQGQVVDYLAIPASLKDAILGRAADLDPTTTEVLTYAAIVGRRFDFDLLLRLTGLAEAQLLAIIERLVERQLVVEEPGSDDRYSFRHALTREAIYDDLLGRERRIKHRAVLAALEELSEGRHEEIVDQLAYHSLHGRELERAARYAELAGARAVQLHAYREAVAHYEVALDLLDSADPHARANIFAQLGHAAYPLGDFTRCARYWREALQLYEQIGDRLHGAEIARWLGRVSWERGDEEGAFAHTHAAIAALENEPPGSELAMAYSALSQLYMITSHSEESILWGERALQLAEACCDIAVKTHALNNIGVSLVERGETERGILCLERSLDLAKQHAMTLDEMRAYLNLGGQLVSLGQLKRTSELLEQAVARAQQVHFDLYTFSFQSLLGHVQMELGNWGRAQELFEQLARQDDALRKYDYVARLADLLLRQGQPEAARQLLERQPAVADHPTAPAVLLMRSAALMRVHETQGQLASAVVALEQALVHYQGCDAHKSQELLLDGMHVYLQAGRPDHAQKLLDMLSGLTKWPLANALYAEGQGLLAAQHGQPSDAAGHFWRAIELWDTLELPFQAARARRRHAASLLQLNDPGAHTTALRDLALARDTFASLGAVGELAACDTLLQRSVRPASQSRRNGLTPRELQVIALIAQGHSNREIAEALTISEKTAEIHVGNILGKLGFSSRAQAAAYAIEHDMAEAPVAIG